MKTRRLLLTLVGALCVLLADCASLMNVDRVRMQAQAPCGVPGHVIRWEASYCMFLSETDDLESPSVQECLANFPLRGYDKSTSECDRKTMLRRTLCRLLIEHGSFDGSLEKCENVPETIPPFVTGED